MSNRCGLKKKRFAKIILTKETPEIIVEQEVGNKEQSKEIRNKGIKCKFTKKIGGHKILVSDLKGHNTLCM